MPRKRLREDYRFKGWAYQAWMIGEPDQAIWDMQKAINALWNKLTARHEALLAELGGDTHAALAEVKAKIKEHLSELPKRSKLTRAKVDKLTARRVFGLLNKVRRTEQGGSLAGALEEWAAKEAAARLQGDERQAAYDRFWEDIAYKAGELEIEGLTLSSNAKLDTHARFQTSVEQFNKGKREKPSPHNGIRKVCIPMILESGGVPVSYIFRNGRQPVSLRYVNDLNSVEDRLSERQRTLLGARAIGRFRVGKVDVPIKVMLHRPLPAGALIKRVSLVGRHCRPFGWKWGLAFGLEIPPVEAAQRVYGIAALDIGWRKLADGLRVVTVFDSEGRCYELPLPWDASTRDTRRLRERARSRGWDAPIDSWSAYWEAQAKRDEGLDQTKSFIGAMLKDIPESIRPSAAAFTKMRNGGLKRLLRVLVTAEEAPPIIELLEAWKQIDDRAHGRLTAARERMAGRRLQVYGEFAAFLATHYDAVILEDFDLAEFAEKSTDDDAAKEAAARYRHMAALYRLRGAIANALAEAGREVRQRPAEYSTQTCSECGAHVPPGLTLVLTCVNGHALDQDANTGRLLVQEELGLSPGELRIAEMRAVTGFLASVERSQFGKLLRPVTVVSKGRTVAV
jgi:hypothetical protein